MEANVSKAFLKATNWDGFLRDNHPDDSPNDEAFRRHFEDLLNPPESPAAKVPDTASMYLIVHHR